MLRDTTLVVFHCGTLERIGIRHRQTQTLYLSDVIDVHACKDPAYGKLHVGLYLAALEDALDRVKQQLSAEEQRDPPIDPSDEGPHRKRIRVHPDPQTGEGHVRGRQEAKGTTKGRGTAKAVRRSKRNTKGIADTIVNHDITAGVLVRSRQFIILIHFVHRHSRTRSHLER